MILQDIIKKTDDGLHKKTIGRYWASDLNSIIKGYITANNYLKEKEIDIRGLTNIFFGVALENELTKRFEEKGIKIRPQEKKELEIAEGVKLVVKPDFVSDTMTIEAKCPEMPLQAIPERYFHQLEAEYRAFPKNKVYLLSFQRPKFLLLEYKPSDERWKEICDNLIKFNNKLIKLNK
jgi:hypothetical protein